MIHPQQDEIRRLIENWAAWTGDQKGAVYSTSPIAWSHEAYANVEASRSRVNVIKPIGAEAQLTGEALAAMDGKEAKALRVYCLTSLTAEMAAREQMHCSKTKYFLLVARGHDAFWNAYQQRLSRAARVREEMAAAGRRAH